MEFPFLIHVCKQAITNAVAAMKAQISI